MKLIEYTLPIYWASYLINGDATGFDIATTPEDPEAGTRDKQEIDNWLASEGNPQFTGVSEDTWFAHTNDATALGGDVATYTAYFTTSRVFHRIMNSAVFRVDGPKIDVLSALTVLCECIQGDDEPAWDAGEGLECTLGDLIVGAYWALAECHAGQASPEYAALCLLGEIYTPYREAGPEENTGEQIAYDLFCEHFAPSQQTVTH